MEEDIQRDDHNSVNKEQDAPIQEYQEEIWIPEVNEISDTESTAPNVILPERERHLVEILEPKIKGHIYMQASKVKNWQIDQKWTNNKILVWNKQKSTQKEYIHNMVSQTSDNIEYNTIEITVMEIMINEINNQYTVKRSSLLETFI